MLPLSGKSDDALRDLAKRYLAWLDHEEDGTSGAALSDMAWTAGVGRSHFQHRAGVVFSDVSQLRDGLRAIADAGAPGGEAPQEAPRVAFVYGGHGGKSVGLGEGLHRSEPVARAVLDRCDDLIRQGRGVSLLDVMFGRSSPDNDLNDPAWACPAAYALECALTAQWASVGIRPSVVVGMGPGRLAAAQAAGVFGLEEGLRLAVTLGDLEKANTRQEAQAARESLETELARITVAPPSVPLVGNAGQVVEPADALDIDYWHCDDMAADEISGCSNTLAGLGVGFVIEVGPGSSLARHVADAWPESAGKPAAISTLARPSDGGPPDPDDGLVRAVAAAYATGLDVSFTGLFAGEVRRRVALPTYPFQRRRHWV